VRSARPSLALSRYAGSFSQPFHGDATVGLEGGRLVLRIAGLRDALPLEHWHYDTFRGAWPLAMLGKSLVTFRLDARGQVAGMTVEGFEGEFARVESPSGRTP
jgi:hypothetical protein